MYGKNEQLLSSVFQDVFNSAREDLSKRAKRRPRGLVDVLGALFVLLNRAEIHHGQLAQLPLCQLIILSSDLKTGRQRFLEAFQAFSEKNRGRTKKNRKKIMLLLHQYAL